MKLSKLHIKKFRSIDDLVIDFSNKSCIVGQNNSGKTNILKAIRLYFEGYSGIRNYSYEDDFPKFVEGGRTTILCVFESGNNPGDLYISEEFLEIRRILKIPSRKDNQSPLSIHLTITENNAYLYQMFPSTKKPSGADLELLNEVTENIMSAIFEMFRVFYVQSGNNISHIYERVILPTLRSEIATGLQEAYAHISSVVSDVNDDINAFLSSSDLSNIRINFHLPVRVEEFINKIEFKITDEYSTDIETKGMGIQSIAIFASFIWMSKYLNKRNYSVLWLLEEPEAFLHPSIMSHQKRVLEQLLMHSTVIYSTHSINFVPSNLKEIIGIRKSAGKSERMNFVSIRDATKEIRNNLGIKFSDYFSLDNINIAVEGPSDRDFIEWFIDLAVKRGIKEMEECLPLLRKARIIDYGGVKNLVGFVKSNFEFIQKEVCYVCLFDSDTAGQEARKELQNYFGNMGLRFEPNFDFVSIRNGYPIEGLFSDSCLKRVHELSPASFQHYSVDAQGNVEPFRLHDDKKSMIGRMLKNLAQEDSSTDWAHLWVSVGRALHSAIRRQVDHLEKKLGVKLDA